MTLTVELFDDVDGNTSGAYVCDHDNPDAWIDLEFDEDISVSLSEMR